MAEAALYNCDGEKVDEITLPDQLFDADANEALVHQALVRLGRVRRVGSAHTKTRAEIRLFDPSGRDIPDPYYGGLPDYEHALDLIEEAARDLIAVLSKPA